MHRPLTGLLLVLAITAARPARADAPADGDKAKQLIASLEAGTGDADAKLAAARDLVAIGPRAQDTITAYLARTRASNNDTRRAVLAKIHAAVPDKAGQFHQPPRDDDHKDADDKIDWLADLVALDPATPGLGEVIGDVVALRALGAARTVTAARAILDAAFGADTMIYRDECGRNLRRMAPYSIPSLFEDSESKLKGDKGYDRRRYATYQLERLDRQEPEKALAAASGDEMLRVAILDAFRTTKVREAVHVVLATVDDDSPRVRAAARAAWMEYVTGPPPPPPPKKHLVLPGGELDKKETALWLTYRDLADNDLRKLSATLLGKAYDDKEPIDLEAVSKEIFARYDGDRQKRDDDRYAQARSKAQAGDLAQATQTLDQLLAANPDRPWRTDAAAVYLAYGKQLGDAQKWNDAQAAYEKAAVLDPTGPGAKDAQAGHDFALGKALEAQGKDGGAAFRRAVALKPDFAEAKKEAERTTPGAATTPWMLYAAGAAGLCALLFVIVGLRRRAA